MKLKLLIEHLEHIADKYDADKAAERPVAICIDFQGTQYNVLLTDVAYSSKFGTILISEDGSII